MTDLSSPLFVTVFGTGPPILCIHGVEAQGLRFVGLAERLPGYRLVAPDLRGHGRSPKVGPWGAEQHLADLLPLLDELGTDTLVLGHSLGGYLAWRLAGLRPAALRALILVDPAIALTDEVVRDCTSFENSVVGHRWPDLRAAFDGLAMSRPDSGVWAAALDTATATVRGEDALIRAVVEPEAVSTVYEFLAEPFRSTAFQAPTLLIEAGREHGRFVSPGVVEGLRGQLDDALEHVVIDATHTIPSDYPDELAAAVNEFLSGLR